MKEWTECIPRGEASQAEASEEGEGLVCSVSGEEGGWIRDMTLFDFKSSVGLPGREETLGAAVEAGSPGGEPEREFPAPLSLSCLWPCLALL